MVTAVSPPCAEHRGCCGKHPAASWQQLLAEHKRPEAGGNGGEEGSFGCQSCSPPPAYVGERGSLLLGWDVPPLHREELCPIPKASWNCKGQS